MRIGQVSVVHQHNAKGCVDIKRLRLFFAVGVACGGVAHLAQAAVAWQGTHVAGAKHIAHHAFGFVHEEFAVKLGDDARSVLASMLQEQQGVINQLIDRRVADNASDSTHAWFSFGQLAPPKHYSGKYRANSLGSKGCTAL